MTSKTQKDDDRQCPDCGDVTDEEGFCETCEAKTTKLTDADRELALLWAENDARLDDEGDRSV